VVELRVGPAVAYVEAQADSINGVKPQPGGDAGKEL
jgi:hypothetical protein